VTDGNPMNYAGVLEGAFVEARSVTEATRALDEANECSARSMREELLMDADTKTVFPLLLPDGGSPMWKQLIPDKTSRRRESTTLDLRVELNRALEHGRMIEALEIYELVEERKPDEPRWSHRKGDLLRRIGREADALRAYERAAHLYSARGFDARAAATAKLILAIDPSKGAVRDHVNRVAERRLRRQHRVEIQLGVRHSH
jgi:tetratricopeptide (TPR) repeat protein